MQCDSIYLAKSLNEMSMNHGIFEYCAKLSAISLGESK